MLHARFAGLPALAVAVVCLATATAQQPPPLVKAHPAQRDLWLGERERFIREWLLLGPVSEADANALAPLGADHGALDAAPRREQKLASGAARSWQPQTSWGDTVTPLAGEIKTGEHAFAGAAIERAAAGDALLMLGGNVRGVWVNGTWVRGFEDNDATLTDARHVTVRFKQGTNLLLLRLKRLDAPARFSARVVEPGFNTPFAGDIDPYIRPDPQNPRRVVLGAQTLEGATPLKFEIIAAGGRVVAERRAARHEVFTLDTGEWPAGSYELRVSTQDSNGVPVIAHRAWFQGDLVAAARRLLSAADAPGATGHVKMLAAMVRDRAGASLDDLTADARAGLLSPLMEYEELLLEAAGKTGGARASGFVRLAWVDATDGSTQFCRAYLPANYSAGTATPAVLNLHGYNPQNPEYVRWWSVSERHDAIAERKGVIALAPHGRGNDGYAWIGKRDVMRCLAEAQKKFSVDADRVYLMGESMGGGGTWLVASSYPEVFAAAAPVFGGWDFRINPNTGFDNPDATRPLERFTLEAQSSFLGAEALRNVPLYVLHGDRDAAVTVEYSRHVVRMLQRWGYDIRYREIPGRIHEDLNAREEIITWMLQHRRAAAREVRVRGMDLTHAHAHWVQVTGQTRLLELIQVRAEILEPGLIRLDTENVASLTLTPPAELASRPSRKFVVDWRGVRSTHDAGAPIHLAATPADAPRAGDKRPGLDGRLSWFFDRPFAIVIGTTARDAETRKLIQSKAETFKAFWLDWQKVPPRMLLDTEVTAEHERTLSLMLIGGADANAVTARRARELPLAVTASGISIAGQRFATTDSVAQLLYPNPQAPDHYLLVVAATSRAGIYFWSPTNLLSAGNGVPLVNSDWTITDGRRVSVARGLGQDRALVASGSFDRHWRRDDALVFPGDAQLRAAGKRRIAPAPDYRVAPEALDVYVGRYQLPNGFVVPIERRGDGLVGLDGAQARPLVPESPDDFVDAIGGGPISFQRDASGKITGFLVSLDGQDFLAKRLN